MCAAVCAHILVCKAMRERSKNTLITFGLDRYDGGMAAVRTIDLSVRDAAHCLQCVDSLSGGRSTTVIHSDTYTETRTHREAQCQHSNIIGDETQHSFMMTHKCTI